MRSLGLLVCVLAGLGCEKKESRIEGPMPVTFGDCAGPNSAWLSGPRPMEFSPENAGDVVPYDPKVVTKAPPKQPEPPPGEEPPPPEDPEGGTGTAMALEEGKMGAKDANEARQQAIEQARNAGVIGSTALQQGGAFATLTGTGDISSGYDDANIYGGLLGDEAGEMNGGFGFGRAGAGPGGGGTGWGTIGTGRYGTISHATGTGSGYGIGGGRGGMRGRSSNVPTVSIGQPSAQGDLDKAIIRRYIKRNIQKITYCYEKELLAKPKLAGTVMTQFFIAPSGAVASSTGSGVDPNVANCVAAVIKDIEFPKPKGGGGVQVNYPFTFRPADPITADAGSAGSAADAGSAAQAPDAAGSGSAVGGGSAEAPKPPADRPKAPTDGYRPGAANPLSGEAAALENCFRKGKSTFGAAVFDFGTASVDVHGIADERVKKCVLGVAKKLKSTGAPQRCSVAYGVMPVAQAPSVEIKADVVTFNGGKVDATAAILADTDFKSPVLFEMLDTRRKVAQSTVVSIHGPLVIKAIDTAKMGVVNKVLNTIRMAGDDFVLAQQVGADFQLVVPMDLPVVPVPFGTGGLWSTPSVGRHLDVLADETVQLSVLVQADKIWVGLSRVNEFIELPRDMTKLAQNLAEQKKSAFFAERTNIEIAGDVDASYKDVVEAIKVARDAGFTRWYLTDPAGLSARPTL